MYPYFTAKSMAVQPARRGCATRAVWVFILRGYGVQFRAEYSILNGTLIPYDLPIQELEKMLYSPIMKDFSLACEALSYKSDPKAYQIMKTHINSKDKYRRLYILKTIYRHPEAVELVDVLESAITCDDFLFVENGLIVVSEYGIKVSERILVTAVRKYCADLYTAVGALKTLAINNENYEEITEIFTVCSKCAQKEVLANILCNGYLPQKSKELFELFKKDAFGKIRLLALEIGKKYGLDVDDFLTDPDGHIRKAVET